MPTRSNGTPADSGRARRAASVHALPRSFYARPTRDVARDLIGKVLVHHASDGVTAGRIVEVEAYIGEDDPACHAAPGPTVRNRPLYGAPGYAYVYLNYGIHFLFNVVTEPVGAPAAVLVRALEPVEGIRLMRLRRGKTDGDGRDADLCRGPGNLTRAMGITLADNREDLCGGRLFVEDRGPVAGHIAWSPRIGISVGTDRPWRACLAGSPAVSGQRTAKGVRSGPVAKRT